MGDRRRWINLAAGTAAQAATCTFLYGIPMLLPQLHREGVGPFRASLVVSAPMAGLLLTLILWGAAADRVGERRVIASGVGGAALVLALACAVSSTIAFAVLLFVAGALGASVNAASGRLVMGWFPPSERGLAMGTRQTAQPLGVALAALVLPPLAHAHGAHLAIAFPAVLCAVTAAAVWWQAADPDRAVAQAGQVAVRSPYRGSRTLPRVHLASSMLVVPQFAVATFSLVYLVGQRHWDTAAAGRLVFAFQLAGAAGRIATGVWSDRVASRLRPMRQLAVASAALMGVIALGAATGSWIVLAGLGFGAVITVADNGLAYTAVAELAGREWSGRALGVQNTVQNVAAVATAPVLAAVIGESRYALGFALVLIFPLIAIPLTPVRAERDLALRAEPQIVRG